MKLLAFLFIFLSIWTDPFGSVGSGILGRLVLADVIGAALIFYFFVILGRKVELNSWFKASFLLLASFTPGILVSYKKTSTLIELLIILFLILIFLVLYNSFKTEDGLKKIIKYFAIASLAAAFVGLWNVVSGIIGAPAIPVFNPRAVLVGIGTFRNTGQAGAYMGISLCVLWAVRFSELFKEIEVTDQKIISIALPLCLVFLLATVKRSALIGFALGLIIWLLMNMGRIRMNMGRIRIKRSTLHKILATSLVIGVSLYGFIYLFQVTEDLRNQFLYKWVQKTPEIIEEDSFIRVNYKLAIQAFLDNPLVGSALGGFGKYSSHEVHSTYFKMIGETGILGIIGYLFFATSILKKLKLRLTGVYGDFIRNMAPFFIGLFVSWGYTYHLRKREFWILLAILAIASKLSAKNFKNPKNQ